MKFLPFLTLFLAPFALSETLELEYSAFYSHIKKLDSEETQGLQFAFGFKRVGQQTLCEIERATVHTQKMDIPLTVTAEQRFTVPNEKALKMARAIVSVDLKEAQNQCDMSVQLETKPQWLKNHYSHEELVSLHRQYQAFFSNMGGLLSFMMPDSEGLVLHFDQPVSELPDSTLVLDDGKLVVDEQWIEANGDLDLTAVPFRITALTR